MSLRRSLFWSLSQQVGMMSLLMLNMVVIARLLTPEEIGIFVLALSIATIVQSLREMGLTSYLIRDPDLKDQTIRACFGMSIALCATLAIGVLLLRHQLEIWIGTPGLAQVLGPVAVVFMLFPIEQPALALIRREMRFKVLHHITLFCKLVAVSTSIGLAYMGFSTMALVWGMLTEAVLRMALLSWAEPRHLKLGPSLRGWKPILGFGLWASAASLTWQAALEGNKIVVGAILGAAPVAIFDRAVRIPAMASMAIFMPLSRVLLSSFSEDLRQGNSIAPKVERITAVTSCIIWPIFAVLAILSSQVVAVVLGPQWDEVAIIMPWLLLAQAIMSLLPQPDQILIPFAKVRRFFMVRLGQLICTLAAAIIALPYGLHIFAMAAPVAAFAMIVVIWIGIAPYMGISMQRLIVGHVKSAIVTAVICVPIMLWETNAVGSGSLAGFILCTVLAILAGLGTVLLVRHPLGDELRRVSGWIAQRQ